MSNENGGFWEEFTKDPKKLIGWFILGLFGVAIILAFLIFWADIQEKTVGTHNKRPWDCCFNLCVSCRFPIITLTSHEADPRATRDALTSEFFWEHFEKHAGC